MYGIDGSQRIIPARAGSTLLPHLLLGSPRDHPRSRGEHYSQAVLMVASIGSSPLARGALANKRRRYLSSRIIPARAGSTARMDGLL